MEKSKKARDAANQEVSELRKALADAERKQREFELALKAEKEKAVVARQETRDIKEKLSDQVKQQSEKLHTLAAENERLSGTLDATRQQTTEVVTKLLELKEKLTEEDKKFAALKTKHASQIRELQTQRNQISDFESQIQHLNSEKAQLRGEITDKTDEIARLRRLVQSYPEPLLAPKKAPWWAYGLAGLCLVAGLALTATGVGAVVGVPLLAGISAVIAFSGIGAGAVIAISALTATSVCAYKDNKSQKQFDRARVDQVRAVAELKQALGEPNRESISPQCDQRDARLSVPLPPCKGGDPTFFAQRGDVLSTQSTRSSNPTLSEARTYRRSM